MKPRTELSLKLFELMCERGYDRGLADLVSRNLNTDFTARRMIGYLKYFDHPSDEEVVDEMLAILSDRNRIMQKKECEASNARWNQILAMGFDNEDDDI
ncbi:MAG: hypothetical protein MJ107_00125 [Lachnospiraceae bacterium]|nr:hypothetical protein [Lachnospiraceae bacterium]